MRKSLRLQRRDAPHNLEHDFHAFVAIMGDQQTDFVRHPFEKNDDIELSIPTPYPGASKLLQPKEILAQFVFDGIYLFTTHWIMRSDIKLLNITVIL
jgi:hypothetical protein